MSSPYPLAALLGAFVYVMRHERHAPDHQRALLRLMRLALGERPVRLEAEGDALRVDGTPIALDTPGASLVAGQLQLHEIGTLTLAPDISDEDLLRLGGVLAAFPGTYGSFADAEAALGSTAARIGLTRVSTEFQVLGGAGTDAAGSLTGDGGQEDSLHRFHGTELDPTRAGAADLIDAPTGGSQPDERPSVDSLLRQGWEAVDRQDWNSLLDAAVQIVDAENEGSFNLAGGIHRIEFKRLMSRRHLGMIARLTHGDRKQEAVTVLRRFGLDAAEVLMELLVESLNLSERRGYYSALIQMNEGTTVIIEHLNHPQWYVVRNAADLCGELALPDAVGALARQIRHPDERVRKSVAEALGKISTPSAIEALARMLGDGSPAVRVQTVAHLNGRRVRGMTHPISDLLHREEDGSVQHEALLALGRIGSPEAIAVLGDWAASGSRAFRNRPVPSRITAIKALGLAGPAAMDALGQLERDPAHDIRQAATQALETLRR